MIKLAFLPIGIQQFFILHKTKIDLFFFLKISCNLILANIICDCTDCTQINHLSSHIISNVNYR